MGLERLEIKSYCDDLLAEVEEQLIAQLQGEMREQTTADILTWLCEQQTQECVGDPKERLRRRHEEDERRRAHRKKKAPKAKTSTPNRPKIGPAWDLLGFGCCNGLGAQVGSDYARKLGVIFTQQLGGREQCLQACESNPLCSHATTGWQHAPAWCVLMSECRLPLDDKPGQCGSTGANGVQTYAINRTSGGRTKSKKFRSKKRNIVKAEKAGHSDL